MRVHSPERRAVANLSAGSEMTCEAMIEVANAIFCQVVASGSLVSTNLELVFFQRGH